MTGTASYTASRGAGWRDRRGRWRCRDRRAKLPARASRWRPHRLRGAARMRWLSVCPSGTSRAPAEIQFDTTRMQEGVHRRRQRNGMRRADEADGDGIDDRAAASGDHVVEPVAGPGRARDLDEGAALRRGLELALARGHEGGREFGNLAQARPRPARMRRDAPAPETRRRKSRSLRRASRPASRAARRRP